MATERKALGSVSQKEFSDLVDLALRASSSYYNTDILIMTDQEYDALTERISDLKSIHPDWDDRGVLGGVGATPVGNVSHDTPMLSLAKTKQQDEVALFVDSLDGEEFIVEPKIDGLAVRAVYRGGVLSLVATRGDGRTGENITASANNISGLPLNINKPIDIEVRGEVYMTDRDFDLANENRTKSGKPPFANPRNATAGVLRSKEIGYVAPMSFSAYDASYDRAPDRYIDRLAIVDGLGISTAIGLVAEYKKAISDKKEILAAIEHIGKLRPSLGFPIDGVVLKINSMNKREQIGANSSTPKWALAFKYPADTATTRLLDIETAIGRTGRLSLRAVLEPVFVGGAKISYATLHHPGFVVDADLRIGDQVYVYRSGDVIPRVTTFNPLARPATAKPWVPPENCPQCDEPLRKDGLLWRCETPSCSIAGRIRYFADRDVMDIEGIDTAIAEAMVESGLVKNIADIYDLTVDSIASIQTGTTPSGEPRTIGKTIAKKIYDSIQASKSQPLHRVITSFGIRGVGRTMGRRIASRLKTLDAFRSATMGTLTQIEGISNIKARMILDGLAEMPDVIDRMVVAGVQTRTQEEKTTKSLPLQGKKVVITGTIPGMSRTQGQEAIESLGGIASSSISASTDLVVVGDGAGSKAQKAESLGIKILPAKDFAEMVESGIAIL